MRFVASLFMLLCLSLSALAGECVVKTTRVACPGKEKEAFSKCDGQASCDEKATTATEKECSEKAVAACTNNRPTINKSKEVEATFDGKPVEGGKNFCAADRPDFNKCEL